MKMKKMLLVVTLFAIILNILNPIIVFAVNIGDIKKEQITVGDINEEGHAKVTKTISKVNDTGRYKVTFDIIGKNNATISKEDAKPYIVYVVDRSQTMSKALCSGCNSRIYYSRKIARESSTELITSYPNAMIAAITFGGNPETKIERNFNNKALTTNSWSGAEGLTPTDEAIKKAVDILKSVNDASSKHIILLSDGVPEDSTGQYTAAAERAKLEATNAKNNGIEIFSVFIQDKYNIDEDAKNLMDSLASLPANTHSFEASNSDSLTDSFKKITDSIIETKVEAPTATNAILTDIIANDFKYVDNSKSSDNIIINDKNVTINIGNIGEENKSYSFDIEIDEDTSTGWHITNDSFTLTGNNLKNTIETTDSSEVYWIQKQYNYKIQYYYDNILDTSKTFSGTLEKNKTLCVNSNMIEENRGDYEYLNTVPQNSCINISSNEENNIIKVYYAKYKTLTIEKELNNISNNNTKFNIEIILKDKNNNLLSGDYKYKLNADTAKTLTFVNGKANIYLKGNDKIEFLNIPLNAKINLEEKNNNGYKTLVCINNDNCENDYKIEKTLTDNIKIKFINVGNYELPETGSSRELIMIITGITFIGGAVIYILKDLLKNK